MPPVINKAIISIYYVLVLLHLDDQDEALVKNMRHLCVA